jgi:hypothetical protein
MKRSVNEYDEGRGGGLRKAAEIGAIAAGGAGIMSGPIKVASLTGEKELERRDAKKREAAAEIKRESRDKEEPMTSGQKQSMQEAKDEEAYQKRRTAPTTKTEMGKGMKKGGMTASRRADGCATKGKTKGRFV